MVDTIEGTAGDDLWFHIDLGNDVFYLQTVAARGCPTYGEETPEGYTLFRTDDGAFAGFTVVNYWRHFGSGALQSATIESVRRTVTGWAAANVPG